MNGIREQVSDFPLKEKPPLDSLLRDEADAAVSSPLSFAQQRLWFLAQLEPHNPSYNLRQTLRLKGELDVNALEQTINHIIARHESLRTTFKTIDGEPVQIISDLHEIDLIFANLEDLPEEEREDEALRLAIAEGWCPFDLSNDYPLRATLVRLDHDHHWLLLTMHHIAGDAWSLGILSRELSRIYESITTNRPVELAELPVQYADFAEWQREWLQGDVYEEQLKYWMSTLAGAPPELKLPTDRPRLAPQSFEGASVSSKLSPELSESIREFSRREGVTMFMTMLAALQTLLFRYTGQGDIVVGTPIAGRNRVEIENLIGFFVNTLALRTNFSGDPTFRGLLARVREVALGAYAHQDMPFEELVRELNPQREGKHSPVFQVMFAMQNEPAEILKLHGITISRVSLPSRTSKFDITLYVTETSSGLAFGCEYNTDLFEEATIRRMLGHLETLLEGVVTNPEQRVSRLPLLTAAEKSQFAEWNDTQSDFPKQCIHQIFAEQATKSANSVALEFEGRKLTFAELDRSANQLAHYFRKRGVGPDDIVGICVERSPEMFVGILGILKAGAAYLPLDPAYPRERLAFMLEDGRAKVLLTQEHLQARLPAHDGETVLVDKQWKEIARESTDAPDITASPENLAYVMYTSGSTGKPKGVAVTHRSVVRLVRETNYAHFGPDEVFLQFAPLSFDASTFEIWGSLLNGGRLVVMPPGLVSLENLGEAIKRHRVTTLWLTAGLFHQMVETQLDSLRGLRQLLAGGNVLSVSHVEQVSRELKDCQLINGYGPTENTTFTCCYPIKRGEKFTSSSVPIGFPVSNTQVYVFDGQMQQVPVGVVGELYTGGAGLAAGYLNDPVQTAEKFVSHPSSNEAGARVYRTGDRARFRADGSIEFLGRVDHQVKLRGFRIELEEIEIAMKQHPAVQDAVVMVRKSANGDRSLVGYVVADSNHPEFGNSVMTGELKALLKKTLPDYMVPSYFVALDKLPLMASGKIDRRALPPVDGTRPELEEAHVAPRDDLERRLVQVFEKLLGVSSIGIRDNFFDLGGHSLLAVRLVSEIEKETGHRLPLVTFFQGATIEYLASILRDDVESRDWPTLVEIQSGDENVPLFCVSMPNVNALGYRSLARYLGSNQPVFGLQAQYPEDLEGEHSQEAVDNIATEYLAALRAQRPKGPYQFVGLCRGAHIAYEMARRLEQEGEEVALLAILDTWVVENTYSIFFYLEHYADRLVWLMRLGLKNQLEFIRKKARGVLMNRTEAKRNPLHEIYFPGPNFVPRTYKGRIAVFRAHRQPRQRIRDVSLGWGRLALGGVDVFYIPGGHIGVLKEPHVQGLANELRKCLLANRESASSNGA